DAAEFELAVSVAASLFRYGSGRELALGLLSIGKESAYFEPKQSQNHNKQILKHLVGVEADGFHSLQHILKEYSRELPAGCFFVLISPQKGSVMMQLLTQLEQLQMNPCHMWIHAIPSHGFDMKGSEQENVKEDWVKAIRSQGYMGYEVSQLADLPNLLGGVKR